MKKNMGLADRIIRLVIAAVLAGLSYFDIIGGTLEIVALVVAAIFALTAIISFCGLYALFGINTCPMKGKKE
jgi:hypothetical protein